MIITFTNTLGWVQRSRNSQSTSDVRYKDTNNPLKHHSSDSHSPYKSPRRHDDSTHQTPSHDFPSGRQYSESNASGPFLSIVHDMPELTAHVQLHPIKKMVPGRAAPQHLHHRGGEMGMPAASSRWRVVFGILRVVLTHLWVSSGSLVSVRRDLRRLWRQVWLRFGTVG